MVTVDDMHKYCVSHNLKLLSDFNYDFWTIEYSANHERYDRVFSKMFKSFKYFLQDYDASVEDVVEEFRTAVADHLFIHHKRYDELFRTYVVSDTDYHLLDNYDVTETMDRTTTEDETDTSNNTVGQQTDNIENKVSPYNTNSYFEDRKADETIGERHDTGYVVRDNDGTEHYTLTKKGNIGIQTGADMLSKHDKFWTPYEYYMFIFRQIAKELLII